jgi:hypothetical protein
MRNLLLIDPHALFWRLERLPQRGVSFAACLAAENGTRIAFY